mmetsp:Transcript_32793/g.78440  ORF Transcript_32793/g.78440 Transcript_32793/m.78440 type:complete len:513 (-) Transcript_32793:230-1768(-)
MLPHLFLAGLALSHASAPQCPFQCVPGLEKMGVGVDLAFFTPKVQQQVTPRKMLKQRVVNMTNANGHIWTNPFVNQTYGVWDQVSELFVNSRSTRDAFKFTFENDFSFEEQFSESVDGDALFGLISASEEMSEMFSMVTKVGATMVVRSGEVDTYTSELYPAQNLSPDGMFLQSAQGIPKLWFSPTAWAGKVVPHMQNYGTHHINTISAGGEFRYTAVVEAAYLSAHGSAEMDAEADADFLFFFSADAEAHASASASEAFRQSLSVREVVCNGGNGQCNANSTAAYNAWVDSVHKYPWVLSARYTPNYALLPADNALVLSMATVAYLAWQGILKLMEELTAIRAALKLYTSLADPLCSYEKMGVCVNGSSVCSHPGSTGDPVTLIPVVRANAQKLYDQTNPLNLQFETTLALQNSSLQVDSWLPNATGWVQAVKELGAVVFSMPTLLECTSYADMSTLALCQIFGCKSHVCQTAAGVKCGNCEAKEPATCAWKSVPIPHKLLSPLPTHQIYV